MKKKKGFTIAELLVTLGIIAVLSVVVAPVANNAMPDKYKTRVLKYYSMIATVTEDMLNNSDIYCTKFKMVNDIYTPECVGLECTDEPTVAPYNTNVYSGNDKYKNLLISMLNLKKLSNGSVVSTDGTIWNITKTNTGHIVALIFGYSNSNASSATEKVYTPNTKNPNTFIFIVENEGKVKGGDALTYTYLQNPNTSSKKEDLRKAATNYTKHFKNYTKHFK